MSFALAALGVSVVGGLLGAKAQKDAASSAAGAQVEAARLGTEETKRQFDKLQELLAPYVKGGETSFIAQQALIGLGGPEAQEEAISAIEKGPQFGAMVEQGEEAILANASATGGIRGGDVQGALATFRPSMLSQLIESQYSKLGGISQMGQASAANVGAAGMDMGTNVAQMLQQSGDAQANAALVGGRSKAQMFNTLGRGAMTYAAMSGGGF